MRLAEIRLVEWVDSASQNGWGTLSELGHHGVSFCRSVGFVVRDGGDEVLLAQSEDYRHGNWGDVIAIPVVAIRQSVTLREPREPAS